jgi:hypothetical protein
MKVRKLVLSNTNGRPIGTAAVESDATEIIVAAVGWDSALRIPVPVAREWHSVSTLKKHQKEWAAYVKRNPDEDVKFDFYPSRYGYPEFYGTENE